MTILHIDFETRSALDLRKVGLDNYARHPTTDVWCMAWALGDDAPQVWLPTLGAAVSPVFVFSHIRSGGHVYAHNAPFELAIWNNIMVPRYGWPPLKPEQTFCTMAMAYAMGLPGSLEDAAIAMGLSIKKDTEGRSLMLRMARPRSTDPLVWWDEPEKLQRLYAYCKQDVEVERELTKRLMPLSETERMVWLMDYEINQRGVEVDLVTAEAAVSLSDKVKEKCAVDLARVTGGAVTSVSAIAALKTWAQSRGVPIDSLAKHIVADTLADDLPPDVRRALTLRQEAGKASIAKFNVMLERAGPDNRLRNMYQYHGSSTGRWAGRAVQTHNLVRNIPKPKTVDAIIELVRKGDADGIDAIYGPPLACISNITRSFFMAKPGHLLLQADFSAVEGRGQAWFAGEEGKLEAFRKADAGTGPGMYELAYARMYSVPPESVGNPSHERQVGKVAELAFGYQGGVGSGKTMGKVYGVVAPDQQWQEWKLAWRSANPRIVRVWYAIQEAATNAIRNPGTAYSCGASGREARFKVVGSFLWCLLPSGRVICYPYPKLLPGQFGDQITYMGQPSQEDRRKGKVIDDPNNTPAWSRMGTYGGSLFNNIVQGFCRDLLANAMMHSPAPVVLHTHDELVGEIPEAQAKDAQLKLAEVMRTPPAWAKGLPLFAEANVMRRYGK